MPPKLETLFHPKKKPQQQQQQGRSPRPNPSPNGKRKPLPPKINEEEEDEELKLPDSEYSEFRVLSSALNGWKYDVFRFDSRKPVDIFHWQPPIKLNRKDTRKGDDSALTAEAPKAVGPMLGPDGKPVVGADGKIVMIDADGRPIHNNSVANGSGSGGSGTSTPNGPGGKDKDKGKAAAKKRFQKKTRQVFPVAEEIRQLRREERYPWVIEDSSANQNELWTAQMEDLGKSETQAFFMPAANSVFKFVPAHRWYKLQKRLKHDLPTDLANVENLYNMNQKRDPQQWLASRKGKPSAATTAMFKAEAEGKDVTIGSSLVHSSGQSLGPGGRKLKTVDSGMDHLFEEDEEGGDGSQRRKEKELGEEGDMDEQVYEADFADDDEHMAVDDNDEEAKEAEERIKKEYRAANKLGDTGLDAADEEEDDSSPMSKQAKAMQKLIKNREGNDAYESEEDKNPYASSEEEEEEEPVVLPTAASAIQEQQQKIESRSQTPKPGTTPRPSLPVQPGGPGSRATSPVLSPVLSPGHGGHSMIAKRATSPKVPKPKVNMSRGNSPLGGQGPLPSSRASSPVNTDVLNGDAKSGLKRKAEGSTSTSLNGVTPEAPKQKKRKAAVPGVAVSSAELETMLLEWLKTTTNASTRDCIHHFTPYLVDAEKKAEFSAMVRKHATLKNGVLVARAGTRSGSAAPSPPASG
ncbi:hypothetical protein CPB83DRAFT_844052 [Crepidotus variabilis]|uniref:Transcription initiation factor IIF subunit alpha n=1 Tax=Crepidotus variabilis TaxID=179855 RepID=A0A9P6ESV8_9AGAR|nr:hypothetical protein CPB83DRAFT_844052 [Crepidotus variabilis]